MSTAESTDRPFRPSAGRRGHVLAVLAVAAALTVPACGGDGSAAEADTTGDAAPVSGVAAVEALVAEYYAAYNAGDADGALGMLSTIMREVSPANLRFWVGALGEQVEATCLPTARSEEALVCIETYTDDLRGPAGLSITSQFQYTVRNGKLQQVGDPGWPYGGAPGCFENRCPGFAHRQDQTGAETTQAYERFDAALWEWLNGAYPDVAAAIGDPDRLGYFAKQADAVAAAIPHVGEFLAAAPEWSPAERSGVDLSDMTALEAVEAFFEAQNSRDSARYAAFHGSEPNMVNQWLWALGTVWEAECGATEDPSQVRCEVEWFDDFYTKAGAVFQFTGLFTLHEGELLNTTEREWSSHEWAYSDFERDFSYWMEDAHPEEWALTFEGTDLAHNPAAASIAVSFLDEFLAQSDEYPRDPGAKER